MIILYNTWFNNNISLILVAEGAYDLFMILRMNSDYFTEFILGFECI
jgi:hypothetical protein